MTDTKQRKTGKAEMKSATDSFYWILSDSTGGTREENYRSAEYNLSRLEKHAAIVANLVAHRPSKPLRKDSHTMERANNVPARVEKFREMYVGKYEQWKIENGRITAC